MKKVFEWLRTSNHWKHLVGGCMIGLASDDAWCAILAGLGISSALEYKDHAWGGSWDWADWSLTVGGVIIGFLMTRWLWR